MVCIAGCRNGKLKENWTCAFLSFLVWKKSVRKVRTRRNLKDLHPSFGLLLLVSPASPCRRYLKRPSSFQECGYSTAAVLAINLADLAVILRSCLRGAEVDSRTEDLQTPHPIRFQQRPTVCEYLPSIKLLDCPSQFPELVTRVCRERGRFFSFFEAIKFLKI